MTTRDTEILHYELSGKGPVIVLLHGYLCSGAYWDTIRARLERHHTVVAIDLLGFGKSPKPRKSNYGYDEHLAWIKRTLEYAHITGPALIAGHSMGALLALRYSVVYPEKTNRLVLMNLPLFEDMNQAKRELAGTNLFFRAALYWRLHYLIVPVMRARGMRVLIRRVAEPMYQGMEEYVFSSSGIARGRSLHNVIEAQKAIDDLDQLSVPTTIVSGQGERRTYIENIQRLKKRKHTDVVLVDTGHHTPLEDPELIADILQQK